MELTIDGQSFDLPGAWEHDLSLGRLLATARSRGETSTMPYVQGTTPFPLRRDEVIVDLTMQVFGDKDSTGTPHANEYLGLADNLLFLTDFVADRMDGTTDTYTATLDVHGARTFTAEVQILNFQLVRHALTVAYVAYDLRIPAGRWTEVP